MDRLTIILPWPPSSLSGHSNGSWRGKSSVVKSYRNTAITLTRAAMNGFVLGEGDIRSEVHFYPPDRRSDRLNFANRMKPYFDGIADALGVNDKRFDIPDCKAHEPDKKLPRVEVIIFPCAENGAKKDKIAGTDATNTRPS